MNLLPWSAFTETSVEAGNNRTRLGLDWIGWKLALKTTITRVKQIPLLAQFFVSAMEFILHRAGTDLVLMTGALAILLWGGVWKSRHIHIASQKKLRQYLESADLMFARRVSFGFGSRRDREARTRRQSAISTATVAATSRNVTMKNPRPSPFTASQAVQPPDQIQECIRKRAYEIYEARGRENGHDLDDWLLGNRK
jgi:hypothetical protein